MLFYFSALKDFYRAPLQPVQSRYPHRLPSGLGNCSGEVLEAMLGMRLHARFFPAVALVDMYFT